MKFLHKIENPHRKLEKKVQKWNAPLSHFPPYDDVISHYISRQMMTSSVWWAAILMHVLPSIMADDWQVVTTDGDHGNPLLQQKKCDVRVDLGFLLDSSGSIRYDYQKEKVSTRGEWGPLPGGGYPITQSRRFFFAFTHSRNERKIKLSWKWVISRNHAEKNSVLTQKFMLLWGLVNHSLEISGNLHKKSEISCFFEKWEISFAKCWCDHGFLINTAW